MNNEYEQGWMKLVDFMFKNPLPKMEMRWEDEERGSWGLEEMRKEFKERLYAKPCEKCGGKGYWEDAIGPLLCGKWEEVFPCVCCSCNQTLILVKRWAVSFFRFRVSSAIGVSPVRNRSSIC